MREIKFRTWDKEAKEMINFKDMYVFVDYFFSYDKFMKLHDLMQYTVLKDKNGHEIYEGDIVNFNSNNPRKIYWDGRKLTYLCEDAEGEVNTLEYLADFEPEVIGNIYENPGLLNGADKKQ